MYEKAVNRKNMHMFCPRPALEELKPEVIAERQTITGEIELAQKISDVRQHRYCREIDDDNELFQFRKMLLSLGRDKGDDMQQADGEQKNEGAETTEDEEGGDEEVADEAEVQAEEEMA